MLCPSKKYIFGLSSTVTSNIAFVKASSVLSIVAFVVESYVTKSYVSTILSFPLDAKRITESFDVKLYLLSKSDLVEISSICAQLLYVHLNLHIDLLNLLQMYIHAYLLM